jgi:hypothetical protein
MFSIQGYRACKLNTYEVTNLKIIVDQRLTILKDK